MFIVASFSLYAEDFIATYTYGDIFVKENSSWLELYPGDELPETAIFRLDAGAQVEFQGDSVTILVIKAGTYNLQSLAEQARTVKKGGSIPLVQSKLKSLVQTVKQGPSAVGGVRAAEVDDGSSVSWFTEDAAEYIEEGKSLMAEGNFTEAADVLQNGLDAALTRSEEDEVKFYLAYALVQDGNYLQALTELNGIAISPQIYYYSDFFLLKGSILLESSVFGEAADFLHTYVSGTASGSAETYQSILLMEGVALLQQGNKVLAKQVLSKVYDLNRTSDSGVQAKKFLDNELSSR